MNGPNTGVGHTSVLLHVELQIDYVIDALTTLRACGLTVFDPKQHVQDHWNEDVQRRLRRTVWSRGGCHSDSYFDATGRNTTLWPGTTGAFRRALARFDVEEYETAEPPDHATDERSAARL